MVIIFGSYGRQLKRIARFIFLQRQILLEMTHIEEVCVSFFIKAFHDISGHDLKHRVRIRVHFTMGPGFYCTVDKKEKPDETFLAKVEARMRELAKWQSQSKSVALILEKLWSCSISMECMTRKGFLRTGGFQR